MVKASSCTAVEPASRKKDVVVHKPQVAPPRPNIPANKHPLRMGADQAGGNKFRGTIGRVTLFNERLAPEAIQSTEIRKRVKATRNHIVHSSLVPPHHRVTYNRQNATGTASLCSCCLNSTR